MFSYTITSALVTCSSASRRLTVLDDKLRLLNTIFVFGSCNMFLEIIYSSMRNTIICTIESNKTT